MLNRLTIQNIAIIDHEEINFEQGLNILSGETGAGKSILIQSIAFALGAKADKGMIRPPARSARVEALFDDDGEAVDQLLKEMEIQREEGDFVVITREIWDSGRSVARVNGQVITLAQLKSLSAVLVDVHGQHEYRYLLDHNRHQGILDGYGGEKLALLLQKADEIARKHNAVLHQREQMNLDEAARIRRMDILQYQISEIEGAGISVGEEERLQQERRRMLNAERVCSYLDEAYDMLYQGSHPAMDQVEQSISKLDKISEMDPTFSGVAEKLRAISYELDDAVEELRGLRNGYEFDDVQLEDAETRLAQLKTLMRKYGASEEAMLIFLDQAKQEYDECFHAEENAQQWEQELKKLQRQWHEASRQLSDLRKETAKRFEDAVIQQIHELGMDKAQFSVAFSPVLTENTLPLGGEEQISFLFSANLGEALHPLDKVASGGELSRMMLALKTVMAETDAVSCMVFDEIDSGISGNMATVVAGKLSHIAKERQVICITHTAQIAAMGDYQFLIQKAEHEGRVKSSVRTIPEEERYLEIARLVGVDMAGKTGQEHAKQMLAWCKEYKSGTV